MYIDRAGDVKAAVSRTRHRVHFGESVVSETLHNASLETASKRAAEILNLRGHVVLQAFADGDQIHIIEVNPRVGGASTLGFAAGCDTPVFSLLEAYGRPLPATVHETPEKMRLVRYSQDVIL